MPSEITGPSSQPSDPVITTSGPEAATAIRTGSQIITGAFLIEGIELFFYDFTEEREKWLVMAATFAISWVQNRIEAHRGRRLIGAST